MTKRTDLSHLKWQLINIRGMSPDEAEGHIQDIINLEKQQKEKEKDKKAQEESKGFQEQFKELVSKRRTK